LGEQTYRKTFPTLPGLPGRTFIQPSPISTDQPYSSAKYHSGTLTKVALLSNFIHALFR
jgi:hypothetical protein